MNTPPPNYERLVFYNPITDTVYDKNTIDVEGYCFLTGVDSKTLTETVWPSVRLVYNPTLPRITMSVDPAFAAEVTVLNTANLPYWKLSKFANVPGRLSGFIEKLFLHLFPIEEDREKVFDWFHHAVVKRAETVLVLCGARGTGKTSAIDILSHLVGEEHSEVASSAPLKDKFNSQFINKRLIKFEEVGFVTQDEISKIKAWCNPKISYESKGQDAKTVDNYSSFAFLLNNSSQLRISYSERRFSVPEVTDRDLKKAISKKELDEFWGALRDREDSAIRQIAEFGNWLTERVPVLRTQDPIRGKGFWRIASLGLREWEQILIRYLATHGEEGKFIHVSQVFPMKNGKVELGELELEKVPRKPVHYEEFFADYRWRGEITIAKVCEEPPGYREEMSKNTGMGSGFKGPKKGNAFQKNSIRSFGFVVSKQFIDAIKADPEEFEYILSSAKTENTDTAGEDLL